MVAVSTFCVHATTNHAELERVPSAAGLALEGSGRARAADSEGSARPALRARPGRRRSTTSAVKSFSPRISAEPDAVGVDGHAGLLERAGSWPTLKPPEATMRTPGKPVASSALRTFHTSCGLTPRGSKRPICGQSERSTIVVGRVEPHAPEPRAERSRDRQRPCATQSLSKSTSTTTSISRADVSTKRRAAAHRVAAVGRDQAVGHGAEPAAAPPRGLRVGRDADGAGDVGGVAVAGLHAVVVVAGREVEDRLAARRAHDLADVASRSACAARGVPR